MAITLVLGTSGTVRYLSNQETPELMESLGPIIWHYRCGHVDSWLDLSTEARSHISAQFPQHICNQKVFWVDILAVGGCVLGPFSNRNVAVKAEEDCLIRHNLPRRL